jgi:hypothetical protein
VTDIVIYDPAGITVLLGTLVCNSTVDTPTDSIMVDTPVIGPLGLEKKPTETSNVELTVEIRETCNFSTVKSWGVYHKLVAEGGIEALVTGVNPLGSKNNSNPFSESCPEYEKDPASTIGTF